MMSWIARNSSDRSSAALAASEIRYVAVCSCAACARSGASILEPPRGGARRRLGDISADQELPPGGGTYLRYHLYEASPFKERSPIELGDLRGGTAHVP